MNFLFLYLLIINALAFLIMLIDKEKAKAKAWRIPERTLMGLAALGGSLGTILAMRICRHKTKHLKFTLGVPILLAIHIIICVLFLIWLKK